MVVAVADNRSEQRERVLAVLYELPGPDGFAGPRLARVECTDALDELAATDAPMSNDAARLAHQQRVTARARAGGGDR